MELAIFSKNRQMQHCLSGKLSLNVVLLYIWALYQTTVTLCILIFIFPYSIENSTYLFKCHD